MSQHASPKFVVVRYKCRNCHACCWIDQACLDKYECDGLPLEIMRPVGGVPTRCSTCARLYEASHQLSNLVVRKPYLLTEGMAGEPEMPSWECEEKQLTKVNSAEDSLGDGMDEKERQSFRDKMMQSLIDSAGKGMTEQDVYGNETELRRYKSNSSTQFEEDSDGRTEADVEAENETAMKKTD